MNYPFKNKHLGVQGPVLLTDCASANCLLALKDYCQDLLKTRNDELMLNTVIFAPDLLEYAFLGVSLSDAKVMRGEYSNESLNEI